MSVSLEWKFKSHLNEINLLMFTCKYWQIIIYFSEVILQKNIGNTRKKKDKNIYMALSVTKNYNFCSSILHFRWFNWWIYFAKEMQMCCEWCNVREISFLLSYFPPMMEKPRDFVSGHAFTCSNVRHNSFSFSSLVWSHFSGIYVIMMTAILEQTRKFSFCCYLPILILMINYILLPQHYS